jgi:DNA-binding transcriptional LysR family regulator
MEFRQLQHFLAAVRHGNMTEAADEYRISQPALSKSIKMLERNLGVRLLDRGRFGVVATPFGEALLVHARTLEGEMRDAVQAVEALKGHGSASVVVGCGPSEASRLLPLALTRFSAAHPDIQVTVLYGLNEALMPMVKQGEVAFALSSIPRTARDPALVHDTLHTDTAAVIARSGHPLAAKRSVKPSDLTPYAWVLARRRELERRALDEMFLTAGLKPVEAEIETTSAELMKTVVMQSDFLTFLPREMIYWEEQAGFLRALRLGPPAWTRVVGVTRRRSGATAAAANALIEALSATAESLYPR